MEADPAGRRPAHSLQLRGGISGEGLQCSERCPPSACPLAPGNVTLFGSSVFVAIIKVKILRRDDLRFRVGPTCTDWSPYKKSHTQEKLRENRAETGDGHKPEPPGASRSWRRQEAPCPGASAGNRALRQLDFSPVRLTLDLWAPGVCENKFLC